MLYLNQKVIVFYVGLLFILIPFFTLNVNSNIFQERIEFKDKYEYMKYNKSFDKILTWVSIITLLIGGFSIMNVLLLSVVERKKEIGMRLSIGALPLDIAALFIIEALILSFIGGFFGVVLGQVVSIYIINNIDWLYHFNVIIALKGFFVAFVVGLFVGNRTTDMLWRGNAHSIGRIIRKTKLYKVVELGDNDSLEHLRTFYLRNNIGF